MHGGTSFSFFLRVRSAGKRPRQTAQRTHHLHRLIGLDDPREEKARTVLRAGGRLWHAGDRVRRRRRRLTRRHLTWTAL